MINNDYFYQNINETEMRFNDDNSSLFRASFALVSETINDEKTTCSTPLKEETPRLENEEISQIEKMKVEEQAKNQAIEFDEFIGCLTKQLINLLEYFSTDDSEVSRAERMIWDIEEKYGARILGEILQNIYVQYNDYPQMLMGICKSISRFELHEVLPWGPTMLVGLLSHKNENVKEYAVSVVENWADIDLLPILRNFDCSSTWLKDYVKDVVSYLEECYALRKKII